MMKRVSITLREATLKMLGRKVAAYKRSQYLDLAAQALLARIDGRLESAEEYERMARELVRS